MRMLLVLRHAKSPRPEGVADHERPILPEGREQIARLARELAEEHILPDLVLASDAWRALATARAYTKAVSGPEPVPARALYEPGDDEAILGAIQACGDSGRILLLVGHNPGLEGLCNRLTKRPLIARLETGALALFGSDVSSWSDLRFGAAGLMGLWHSH